MIKITFLTNDGMTVEAPDDSNLLRVSLRQRGGIPFKCGAGICGTCRCKIEKGIEHTDKVKAKERNHLTNEDLAQGYRMACQTFVKGGDVEVSWIPLDQRKPAPPRRPASASSQPVLQAAASVTPSTGQGDN